MNTSDLRKASQAIFLACPEEVAKDISGYLCGAAEEIDRLRTEIGIAERGNGAESKDKLELLIIEMKAERKQYLDDARCLGQGGSYIRAHNLIIKAEALGRVLGLIIP